MIKELAHKKGLLDGKPLKIQNLELDADLHNFGRKTTLGVDGRITKHRSLLPEYVFFGSDSSFRQHVNRLFTFICPQGVLLPGLKFYTTPDAQISLEPQEIELLRLAPLDRSFRPTDYHQVGAYIALCAFVGLNDSHRHNLMLGLKDDQFTFVSVDCETILSDIPHAVTLGLFRSETQCPCKSKYCFHYGLSSLKLASDEHLASMPADIIWGHRAMRKLLLENQTLLQAEFTKTVRGQPLVLRKFYNNTHVYAQALKTRDFSAFSPEEIQQLERGDIPYFFQVLGDDNSYYWTGDRTYVRHSKSAAESLYKTRPGFEHGEILAAQIMLLIASSVDFWPGRISQSVSGDIRVLYKKDSIVVIADGQALSLPRMPL